MAFQDLTPILYTIGYPAMRQLMENDTIQERYGNDEEPKRVFKQQIEQPHGLYHDRIP